MKTGLLVMCLALLPVAAQERPELQHLTVGSQPGRPAVPAVRLTAQSIDQNSGIVHLKGSVEIKMELHTLLADEAEYDLNSGEIQAHGSVHLKPAILDTRGASQFGVK